MSRHMIDMSANTRFKHIFGKILGDLLGKTDHTCVMRKKKFVKKYFSSTGNKRRHVTESCLSW